MPYLTCRDHALGVRLPCCSNDYLPDFLLAVKRALGIASQFLSPISSTLLNLR